MEIELDRIAFTAEVKEGLYAGSSFGGGSSDHQGTCKEGSEEGGNCQGTWGDRRDSLLSSKGNRSHVTVHIPPGQRQPFSGFQEHRLMHKIGALCLLIRT